MIRVLPASVICVLAKALVAVGQRKEAEEILRDCLKTVPNDLRSILGLTALLLQRGDQPDALSEAGPRIGEAVHLIHPDSPPVLVRNLGALTAVFFGLTDEPEKGRAFLRQLLANGQETP